MEEKVCKQCGKTFTGNFCTHCGAKGGELVCGKCGTVAKKGDFFCASCGAKLAFSKPKPQIVAQPIAKKQEEKPTVDKTEKGKKLYGAFKKSNVILPLVFAVVCLLVCIAPYASVLGMSFGSLYFHAFEANAVCLVALLSIVLLLGLSVFGLVYAVKKKYFTFDKAKKKERKILNVVSIVSLVIYALIFVLSICMFVDIIGELSLVGASPILLFVLSLFSFVYGTITVAFVLKFQKRNSKLISVNDVAENEKPKMDKKTMAYISLKKVSAIMPIVLAVFLLLIGIAPYATLFGMNFGNFYNFAFGGETTELTAVCLVAFWVAVVLLAFGGFNLAYGLKHHCFSIDQTCKKARKKLKIFSIILTLLYAIIFVLSICMFVQIGGEGLKIGASAILFFVFSFLCFCISVISVVCVNKFQKQNDKIISSNDVELENGTDKIEKPDMSIYKGVLKPYKILLSVIVGVSFILYSCVIVQLVCLMIDYSSSSIVLVGYICIILCVILTILSIVTLSRTPLLNGVMKKVQKSETSIDVKKLDKTLKRIRRVAVFYVICFIFISILLYMLSCFNLFASSIVDKWKYAIEYMSAPHAIWVSGEDLLPICALFALIGDVCAIVGTITLISLQIIARKKRTKYMKEKSASYLSVEEIAFGLAEERTNYAGYLVEKRKWLYGRYILADGTFDGNVLAVKTKSYLSRFMIGFVSAVLVAAFVTATVLSAIATTNWNKSVFNGSNLKSFIAYTEQGELVDRIYEPIENSKNADCWTFYDGTYYAIAKQREEAVKNFDVEKMLELDMVSKEKTYKQVSIYFENTWSYNSGVSKIEYNAKAKSGDSANPFAEKTISSVEVELIRYTVTFDVVSAYEAAENNPNGYFGYYNIEDFCISELSVLDKGKGEITVSKSYANSGNSYNLYGPIITLYAKISYSDGSYVYTPVPMNYDETTAGTYVINQSNNYGTYSITVTVQ